MFLPVSKFVVRHTPCGTLIFLLTLTSGCGQAPAPKSPVVSVATLAGRTIAKPATPAVAAATPISAPAPNRAAVASAEHPANLPTPQPLTPGHMKMLAVLEQIRQRTPDENIFLGDRKAKDLTKLLASWKAGDDIAQRWMWLWLLGQLEVRLGQEQASIGHLKEAYDLLPQVKGKVGDNYVNDTILQLAVSYLRLGETQNCCVRNTPESCIVPIRGAGIHTNPEGSTTAIQYLEELLERPNLAADRAMIARYLLNIAYMTIGEYPDSVPIRYRIPTESFTSGIEFPKFPNIAAKLGVNTFNLCGSAVVDDYNGDGYLDIFSSTFDTAGEPHLFINNANGGFVECAHDAGLAKLYGGLNAVQADYDNDGDVDVLVLRGAWLAEAGRHPSSLLANDGHGNFSDVTFAAGLGDVFYPTHSAAFFDYDNDGDLDLYVGHESSQTIKAPSQLFRNNGNGTFTDVAAAAGVENLRFAKGVVAGDYDGDDFPDLYVSNVHDRNRLYRNNHDGTFTDVAPDLKVQLPIDSFPTWFWDFDNDGALDIFVASYGSRIPTVAAYFFKRKPTFEPSHLYRGDGHGGFEDVTERTGLDKYPMLVMGANFGDLNNDGFLDMYLGTGDPDFWSLMPKLCFLNRGGERFFNVTMASGMGHLQKGHGVSFADFDNDGDLDVYEQMGGAYPGDKFNDVLYENPGFGSNWLGVELVGTRSNRSAIGARLHAVVEEPNGSTHSVYRHVNSGGSFGSNPLRQTLGLGKNGKLRSLEVYWPTTGETQRFTDLPTNEVIRITEGKHDFTVLQLKKLDFSPEQNEATAATAAL